MTSLFLHTVNKVAKTSDFVLVLHKLRPFSFILPSCSSGILRGSKISFQLILDNYML
jgi:hypothetical protein